MQDNRPFNRTELLLRREVKTAVHKGGFWKPCPGTSGDYLCCGYQILTPMTGCGMYCAYCVLQAYFDHRHQTVFENFDDLEREVHHKMENIPEYRDKVVRIGTGEFSDSLYQEDKFGLSKKVAAVFDRYDNVLLEFKTKSVNVSTLGKIKNPRKTVIGFSMNTERMVSLLEHGTAPITARLTAARRCEEMGFNVAFHFDPIVWYKEWEEEYRRTVSMIYDYIRDPESIAWCSMGAFRCMPSLKSYLRQDANHILLKKYNILSDNNNILLKKYDSSPQEDNILPTQSYMALFAGEMMIGADGKLRYPRTIRAEFYRALDNEFRKHHPNATLYLCMESREVWEDSNMYARISKDKKNKLTSLLDRRAESILAL